MTEETNIAPIFSISDRAYDVLSALVRYVLPGTATLYLALAALWNFPSPTEVAGSITAVTTFLGIFLSISKRRYIALTPAEPPKIGDLLVDMHEDGLQAMTVALEKPLEELGLEKESQVTLNVVKNKLHTEPDA